MPQSDRQNDSIQFFYDSKDPDDVFYSHASQIYNFYFSYTDSLLDSQNTLKDSQITQNHPKYIDSSILYQVEPFKGKIQSKEREVLFSLQQIQKMKLTEQMDKKIILSEITLPTEKIISQIKMKEWKNSLSILNFCSQEDQKSSSPNSLFNNNLNKNKQKCVIRQSKRSGNRKQKNKKYQYLKFNRKRKNQQSKAQKFIRYMTRYYFNKNFTQYMNKRLFQKQINPQIFNSYQLDEKILVIDEIIQSLKFYPMSIHYSVKNGRFFKSFSIEEQNYIKDFFQRLIRRTYHIKLETTKRRFLTLKNNENFEQNNYLDIKGENEFRNSFDQILRIQPYYRDLLGCNFQQKLWKVVQG